MKKFSVLVKQVLMSTLTAGVFTFSLTACSDDNMLDNEGEVMNSMTTQSMDLKNLESYSYSVPFEIKCEGDWSVDFAFNEGEPFCYAFPKRGHGPQTIKICTIDNTNTDPRSGELIVNDLSGDATSVTLPICQQGVAAGTRAAGEAKDIVKGWRIYGVGYGFNAMTNELGESPIVRMEELYDQGYLTKDAIDLRVEERRYTGSCHSELTNNLKTEAKFSGKYFGFEGEAGATFDMKSFKETNKEYAIGMVDVAVQKAHIEANDDEIKVDYMTDAAYAAINGLPYKSQKNGRTTNSYKTNREGFKKLIAAYGTHMLVAADLGGKMKYATTIDVEKVENSYDLNAYAKCSYKNKYISASGSVSDEMKNSYNKNDSATSIKITVTGGSDDAAFALRNKDCDANMEAWINSLKKDINKSVVNVTEAKMIPLYELINEDEDGVDPNRKQALKDYMTNGEMEEDFMNHESQVIETGTITHIKRIPTFTNGNRETLIKDIYEGGRLVARVCNEFIPQLDRENRVTVIYPVINNWAKYNMGYYIGSRTCSPQRICWKTDGTVSITKVDNEGVGIKTELYLRGTTFYNAGDAAIKDCKETIIDGTEKNAWMKMKVENNLQIWDAAIVKIFNRIWTREHYTANNNGNTIWYELGKQDFLDTDNWSCATKEDFEDLKNGLTNANIELPGLYMSDINGGRDLTGFNTEWDLGYRSGGSWVHSAMEYWACTADKKKNVVVHFDKKGGMSFRELNSKDKGAYAARMVQPLRPNIKK